MSRTRAAPTPTNISTKSDPEIEKNGTLASPAIAFASSVLPVPGLPTISTPRGMRPPSFWNLEGSRRNSTSSETSSFASSHPATSANVTVLFDSSSMRALLLPNENAPPRPPPCIWRMKKIQTPISNSIGNQLMNSCARKLCSSSGFASTLTPYLTRSPTIQMSLGLYVMNFFLSADTQRIVRPSTVADSTPPDFALSMNSEYETVSFVVWRASNCFTTIITTSAMTSQMPTFLSRLFKVTPCGEKSWAAACPSSFYAPAVPSDAGASYLSLSDPMRPVGIVGGVACRRQFWPAFDGNYALRPFPTR